MGFTLYEAKLCDLYCTLIIIILSNFKDTYTYEMHYLEINLCACFTKKKNEKIVNLL